MRIHAVTQADGYAHACEDFSDLLMQMYTHTFRYTCAETDQGDDRLASTSVQTCTSPTTHTDMVGRAHCYKCADACAYALSLTLLRHAPLQPYSVSVCAATSPLSQHNSEAGNASTQKLVPAVARLSKIYDKP